MHRYEHCTHQRCVSPPHWQGNSEKAQDGSQGSISRRENVRLTLAINDYDQVRDLVSGLVPVDGIDLTCLVLPVEETFFRFSNFREWHVSELSMGKYCSLRARGD